MNTQNTNLSQFFPMIRAKELILDEISSSESLCSVYESWRSDQQEQFLDILTGVKGVKMLYDSFFKEILNPEAAPERLSRLLSLLIGRKVTVKCQLSNDNSRLGDEMSLVITDIAPVYTIVFLEASPKIFKEFNDQYIHTFFTVSDTGLSLNMLQNFIFVPIDIFLDKLHNKGIDNELDAWLTFLGCDEPEYIIKLIQQYPYFKPLYDDLYNMCLNTERILNMFSKELQILDRNTVKYMIDELQDELDAANEKLSAANTTITEKDSTISEMAALIASLQSELDALKSKGSDNK